MSQAYDYMLISIMIVNTLLKPISKKILLKPNSYILLNPITNVNMTQTKWLHYSKQMKIDILGKPIIGIENISMGQYYNDTLI